MPCGGTPGLHREATPRSCAAPRLRPGCAFDLVGSSRFLHFRSSVPGGMIRFRIKHQHGKSPEDRTPI